MTKYTGPIKEVEVVEKVKLTKEQAHEFECFKSLRNSLEEWARDKQDPNAAHSIIHELTFDEMARAYYIGYEIDNSYKNGDKVLFQIGDSVPRVVTLQDRHPKYENEWRTYHGCGFIAEHHFRLATEEEIFWIGELGREKVGDFREGDVIFTIYDSVFKVVNSEFGSDDFVSVTNAKALKLVGIYPAESFRPFPKEQSNER